MGVVQNRPSGSAICDIVTSKTLGGENCDRTNHMGDR